MLLIRQTSIFRIFLKTALCCLLVSSTLIRADSHAVAGQQRDSVIDLQSLQQLLDILEQQSQILEADTANYIRCLEQNTRAESGELPETQLPEIITREWITQLLNNLSAGVNSSETCQFLLDEILQKLPQLPPADAEPEKGV